MTSTNIEQIYERIKRIEDARRLASPGPWGANETRPGIYTEEPVTFTDEIAHDMRLKVDRDFTVLAANESDWLTTSLKECLERLREVTEESIDIESGDKIITAPMVSACTETLAKIAGGK